jgi:hypothetical protein
MRVPVFQKPFQYKPSDALHQIGDFRAECVGNDFESLNRDVRFAALDFSHVRTVQAGAICERILREALGRPQFSNVRTNVFLNILHLLAVWLYAGQNHTGHNRYRETAKWTALNYRKIAASRYARFD